MPSGINDPGISAPGINTPGINAPGINTLWKIALESNPL